MLKIGILSISISLVLLALWNTRRFFNWIFRHIPFVKQREYSHRYLSNLLIGLGVFWLLISFQHIPLLMDYEDANLDLAMQLQEEIPAIDDRLPFLFLDIDDRTHEKWGEPLFTPRHHIKELIDAAVKGGAKLVIVDVDLTRQVSLEGLSQEKLLLHPYDHELYDFLKGYKTEYCQENKACPPIILVRMVRSPLSSSSDDEEGEFFKEIWEKSHEPFSPIPIPILESLPSFLDAAVEQSAPYVQWASPLFWKSSYDGAIRRWWLWQAICTDNQTDIIPSVELLAATMVLSDGPEAAKNSIDKALSGFKPKHCTDSYNLPWKSSPKMLEIVQGLTITDGVRGVRQRIMYRLPWRYPVKTRGTVRDTFNDEAGNEVLTIVPAKPYLGLSEGIKTQFAENRIVVIGGSYAQGGDMHATPLLEEMPGGLIIINAIHSLLQNEGELKQLDDWIRWTIVFVLLIFFTWVFSFIHSVPRVIFVGLVFFLCAIVTSVWLLRWGIWLNFALPLLIVEICEITAKIDDWVYTNQQELDRVTDKYFKNVNARLQKMLMTFPRVKLESQDLNDRLTAIKLQPQTNSQEKEELLKEVVVPK